MRARWVEAEGLKLKRMGMSYDALAAHITTVGRGLEPPVVALLDGVTFPTNYRISKTSVYLAVKAALAAAPRHEAEEYRQLQADRCEEMLFALQTGIRADNPPHVSSAVKVLQTPGRPPRADRGERQRRYAGLPDHYSHRGATLTRTVPSRSRLPMNPRNRRRGFIGFARGCPLPKHRGRASNSHQDYRESWEPGSGQPMTDAMDYLFAASKIS